jgi:flagellar secretion chaperone FliS
MHVAHRHALNAYNRVSVETGVASADPHRLILMLFEGARVAVATARGHMQRGEIAPKGQAISKAIAIIDDGLKVSLDIKAGGQIAERLHALYEYISNRLVVANLDNSLEILDEVSRLLGELHDAWAAIAHPKVAVAGA